MTARSPFLREPAAADPAIDTVTSTRGVTVTRFAQTRRGRVAAGAAWARRGIRSVVGAVVRARDWVRDTVSPAGLVLVAVAVAGAAAGVAFGWFEAWVVAVMAASLLLACVPFLLGAHDYRVRLDLDRDRVVAGSEIRGTLDLVNRGSRVSMPSVVDIPVGRGLVEAHIPLLRGGAHHEERLVIAAQRRGVIDVGPMTVSRGDPLRVLRREMRWPEVQRVHVHPVTVALPPSSAGLVRDLEGAPSTDLVDADLSFHAVRQYVPGDSQRHVHWKSTARTGRLMVRQYEESRHARIAVLLDLDLDGYSSDDEFEVAVSAAASLGVQGVREGRDVLVGVSSELDTADRGAVQAMRSLQTATPRSLLDGVAALHGASASGAGARVIRLESVATLVAQSFGDLSIAFLVTGSHVPLERLRRAAISLPQGIAVVAVRCDPEAEPRARRSRELIVLTLGRLDDLAQMLARGAAR
ncbi:Uncharacterized conserved protein, DUF58 family, contains vWF domain [Agromyces sp. CF514]|uniref:DUF58 domain-containing protein n=1 Tax=Agromyces sp. CF514 TaxID=1881031 RepID=UPI0008E054A3|nr:DUF58 domain-containing protein [Agromyces sp. CF514]SFR68199.1 Uncharacterized conserved protein, DUF58 family, contains vWF domain [Agromyces sp. CF514]